MRSHSEETRRRIGRNVRRYHERKRLSARIRPRDLRRLRETGTVAESLRPIVEAGEDELAELVEALGGVDALTPMKRALIEDAASVGVVLRGELGRYLQNEDPTAAARVGTLAGVRRQTFLALGLDPRKAEPIDLTTYLDQKARTSLRGADPSGGE